MVLSPCIEGFQHGCRPYLSVDGTYLTSKWSGVLASARALDDMNYMFPVAFVLFDKENDENWHWFMSQLKRSIGDMSPLAISDNACRGLHNAVKAIFPKAERRECFSHLMLNLYKHYAGSAFTFMWPAARSYHPRAHTNFMEKIYTECPGFEKWLKIHRSEERRVGKGCRL